MADDESTFGPDFDDIEALLRDLDSDDLALDTPPDDVWSGIADELGLDDDLRHDGRDAGGGTVRAAPFGRRRPWMAPLAAAAAIVLVVAFGVVAFTGSSPSSELARAELAFEPGFDPAGADAAASAALVDDDGVELIRIDDASLPFDLDEDASLEVWLIAADGDGNVVDLVSLGDLEPDGSRTFTVPAGYDPAVFTVVDISIEPHDGDESHSGRSILRGALIA